MAHFAELDHNNKVLRVVVIDNKDTSDAHGIEKESIGAAFCEKMFGGKWIQTSYNGNFRKNYAGIGFSYHPYLDVFVPPKPFPSWILNASTIVWEPPVPQPNDYKRYIWDEVNLTWMEIV